MKHRSIALAMALALSLSMMTACGSKEQPSQSDASTPDASISTPAVSTPDVSIPDASTPDASTPEETPAAPDQSEPEMEEIADLSLNKTDFTLFKAGDSYQLQAIQTKANGKELVWSSNNEKIATVSEDGTVTAVAPGNAVITVNAGDLTAACTVRCKFEADAPVSGTEQKPAQKPEQAPEQKPEQKPEQAPEQKPVQKPEESKPATPSVDLSAFYNKIMNSISEENRPFMVEYDSEMANAWYPGLGDVELKQRVMHQAGMTAVPVELVFVECANSADVATVKNIFQTRVDNMVNDHFNYPFVVETWTNEAKVLAKGNYVALIVMPADSGMMDAAAAFNALF